MNMLKRTRQLADSFPLLLNDFFTRDLYDWNESNFSNSGTTVPAVNIKETKESFEVEMAAPGMSKNDFKIHLNGNHLTISAEGNNEGDEKIASNYSKREFS